MARIQPPGLPIERGKVHEFANAILDPNPLYHDEEAARAAGFPSVVAPPTYSVSGAHYALPTAERGALEGVDVRSALHGSSEFVFERPLFAGDLLQAEPGETRTWEKQGRRGGRMKFIEMQTVFRDQNGDVVLRSSMTIIQPERVVER